MHSILHGHVIARHFLHGGVEAPDQEGEGGARGPNRPVGGGVGTRRRGGDAAAGMETVGEGGLETRE